MKEVKEKTEVKLVKAVRKKNNNMINLYIFIDGKRFELVPHCRTIKETAYFYHLLDLSSIENMNG